MRRSAGLSLGKAGWRLRRRPFVRPPDSLAWTPLLPSLLCGLAVPPSAPLSTGFWGHQTELRKVSINATKHAKRSSLTPQPSGYSTPWKTLRLVRLPEAQLCPAGPTSAGHGGEAVGPVAWDKLPLSAPLAAPPPIPILITKKADRRGPERGSDLLKITQCIGPRVGWGSRGSGGAPAEDQMACREESAQQHLCVGLRPPPTSSADEEAGHTANLGRSQPRSLWASKAATHRRGGSLSTLPSTQYALRKCGHTGSTVTRQTRGIQHSCLMPLT